MRRRCTFHSRGDIDENRLIFRYTLTLFGRLATVVRSSHPRAALTPSRVANEVSLAVRRKSRMNGASSISARIPA